MRALKQFLFTHTSTQQVIAKNIVWLFLGEGISRVMKMVLLVYGARMLGVTEWGLFSYALSLALVFSFVADMGLHTLTTKEFSRDVAAVDRTALVVAKLLLSTVTYLIILAFSALPTKIALSTGMGIWIGIFTVVDSGKDFLFGIIRAKERMEREALIKIGANLLTIGLGFFGIIVMRSPLWLLIAYSCGSAAALLAALPFLPHFAPAVSFSALARSVKKVLVHAAPFMLILLSTTVLFNSDGVIIGLLRGTEDAGLYSVGQKLIQLLYVLPYLLSLALLPHMIKSAEHAHQSKQAVFIETVTVVIGMALPIALIGSFFSSDIITSIYGATYRAAAPSFAILILSIVAVFPLHIINNFMIAENNQWRYLRSHLIAVALLLLSHLVLIPRIGTIGAALTTTGSLFVLGMLAWKGTMIPFRTLLGKMKFFIGGGMGMGIVIALTAMVLPSVLSIVLGLLSYCSILLFFKEPTLLRWYRIIRPLS